MKYLAVRHRRRLPPDLRFRRRYWLFSFLVAGFGLGVWEWWQWLGYAACNSASR